MDLYLDKVPLYLIDYEKGQILNINAKDIMFNGCKNDGKNIKKRTYTIKTNTFVISNVLVDKELFITETNAITYMLMKTKRMIASFDEINMFKEHNSHSVESIYHDYQQKKCFEKRLDRIYNIKKN